MPLPKGGGFFFRSSRFSVQNDKKNNPSKVFRTFAFPWRKVPNGCEADEGKPYRMISVVDDIFRRAFPSSVTLTRDSFPQGKPLARSFAECHPDKFRFVGDDAHIVPPYPSVVFSGVPPVFSDAVLRGRRFALTITPENGIPQLSVKRVFFAVFLAISFGIGYNKKIDSGILEKTLCPTAAN